MATYAELITAAEDAGLRNKVRAAICVSADEVRVEVGSVTNHANRVKWAKNALSDPDRYVIPMLKAAIATNRSLTLSQITSASDSAVQTAVDLFVDVFADGT